jgi:hypothetical protein
MEFVSAALPKPKPLYFVNRWVDWGIIGGVSVVFFLVLQGFLAGGSSSVNTYLHTRQEWAWTLAAWLSWVINWPHFSATNYRLYHSKRTFSQYPFTAFMVPVLLLAATWASFAYPDAVAPFLVKLFLIWSPYHFSGQSLGISMIYARRAGFQVGRIERFALSGFIFGTYIHSTARSEALLGDYTYYNVTVPFLGIPAWVPKYAEYGMYACGALLLLLVVKWSVKNRRILPPIVLLPAAAQFIWFVPGGLIANFNEFVPMFHSLQYMLIAWSMQVKERVDETGVAPTGGFVFGESARWLVINIAGGAFLFYLLPEFTAKAGWSTQFTYPVILSAVQIHHFFVDGVIWKLKNPKVSSPLLVNIPDLLRRPEPARAPA